MSGNLFVVAAPSGAGKTTLVRLLLEQESRVHLSISYTTRGPRPGEENGREYHFVDNVEFQAMIARHEFLEWAEVHGNFYGTSQKWIADQLAAGHDVLLEIDWQGAQQVRKLFPQAIGVFILPPSLQALEQRLRGRGTDSEESISKRMASAREEITHVDEFDFVIVNEVMDEAIKDLISLVRAPRLGIARQSAKYAALFSALKG